MIKRFITFVIISFIFISCDNSTKNNSSNEANTTKNNNPSQGIPKITASANKNKVHVGDIINLSLKYFIPENSTFNPDTDLTGFEGLTLTGKKSAKGEITLTIIVDKTASFDIGPVSLTFKDSKHIQNIIRSEALHIEVLSNLGDKPAEAQLKPIMSIIPTYPFILRLLPWIAGLLVLGAAGLGFYLWKRRDQRKAEALKNIKPAYIIAKEEIEKLKAGNLVEKGEYKEFYFRFSEIIRRYIETLRGFPAVELTTEEIFRRIKEDIDRNLVPILREADLVKFADAIPTKAKSNEDIVAALEYIKATTPVVETEDSQRGMS
jgi:hypothetical protein